MKISACVITKNEEKNIVNWLREMDDIADEMVVVDTGSADNTVMIAQKSGAKVYNFKWINDFAAAKNYAIDKASGEWILFLDADEFFSQDTKVNLRKVLEQHHKNKKVGGIMCRLTNIDRDYNDKIIDSMLQVRIFRNIPGIRYEGKIHENIRNRKGNLAMIFSNKLEIYHTGYSASIIKSKAERNLKIIKKKQEAEGDTYEVIAGLMDAYNILGQYDEAAKYARKAIELNMHFIGMEGHSYEILISALANSLDTNNNTLQELYDTLDDAMSALPEEAAFPLEKGYVLWQHKDYINAEKFFQKGLLLRKKFDEISAKGIGITDNSRRMLPLAYHGLGDIALLRGNIVKAADYFITGIEIYKYNAGLIRGLCKCLKSAEPSDIIASICQYYDKENDAKFICDSLYKVVNYRVYQYFEKYLHTDYRMQYDATEKRSIADYLGLGYYNSASIVAANRLSRLYRLSVITMDYVEENRHLLNILLPLKYKNLLESSNEQKSINRLRKVCGNILTDTPDNPLVSIMIPTYNRPHMFEETLQSALSQTYNNIEIIINDNSTNDETENLMQKYLGDKRVRYYRNKYVKTKRENFMPFERQARGSMLQWCMDDDLLAPEKIKIMVQILRNNPNVTLVTSQRGFIDESGNEIPRDENDLLPIKEDFSCYDGSTFGKFTLTTCRNIIGEPSATLFRRNDLTHHYWEAECKGLKTISDVAMWLELLEKGALVIFKDPLSYYRRHSQQEGQQPEVVILSRIEWVKLIDEYYSKKIFINNEEDYKGALKRLYDEYRGAIDNVDWVMNANNVSEYRETMMRIGKLL